MGHPVKATGIGVLYLIFLVALPLGFITITSSYISANGGDPGRYFHGTSLYVLVFGIGSALFAALGAYFDRGSTKRLGLSLTSSVLLALWGYLFIGTMSIYYEGDTYSYEVLMPGIAAILAISLSFKIIYRVVEYRAYRGEYLNGGFSESPAEMPTASPNIEEDEEVRYF